MTKKVLVIISGPSGVGKTTIVNRLLELIPNSSRLVTTTTRLPREKEINGKDYWFITREEFLSRAEEGDFIEWVDSYGHLYGTSHSKLSGLLVSHYVVFVTLDTRGVFSLKEKYPQAVSVFIKPGSLAELEQRIRSRHLSPEEIERRMGAAVEKIKQSERFDYTVTNAEEELNKTIALILKIVKSHTVWRIGVDLDGVIINHTDNKILVAKRFGVNLTAEETPSNVMQTRFEPAVYRQIKHIVYDDPSIALLAPPMSGTKEVLTQLKIAEFPLYLVSMRPDPENGGAIEWLTMHRFWNEYFDNKNSFFVKERNEKDIVARSLSLDVYLDDELTTLEMMPSVPHRFLFDPLNVYPQNDFYTKVGSWAEFGNKVLSL